VTTRGPDVTDFESKQIIKFIKTAQMGGLFNLAVKTMSNKKLAIYYEHPDWFRPLFAELDERGVEYERLDAARHFFDPAVDYGEKYSLFFNRMSASAYLRGHGNAVLYTRGLLANFERQGLRVVNGYQAFEIEISKNKSGQFA
jgi:hypothetical protein